MKEEDLGGGSLGYINDKSCVVCSNIPSSILYTLFIPTTTTTTTALYKWINDNDDDEHSQKNNLNACNKR